MGERNLTLHDMQTVIANFDIASEQQRDATRRIASSNGGAEKQIQAWDNLVATRKAGEHFYSNTTPQQREQLVELQLEHELQRELEETQRVFISASSLDKPLAEQKIKQARQDLVNIAYINDLTFTPLPNSLSFRITGPNFDIGYGEAQGVKPEQYFGTADGHPLTHKEAKEKMTALLPLRGLLQRKAAMLQRINMFAPNA